MRIKQNILFATLFLTLAPLPSYATPQLRVCLPEENAPYAFVDDEGIRRGFDMDILDALQLPYDVEFIPQEFATALAMLDNDTCQMLLSSHMITPTMKKRFLFSSPHLQSNLHALVLEQSPLESNDDLHYSIVGVLKGSSAEKFAFTKLTDSTIIALTREEDLISLLLNGEIETVLGDRTFLQKVQNEHEDLHLLEPQLKEQLFGYIFSKKHLTLRDEVNEKIKHLEQAGVLTKIYEQWFEQKEPQTVVE